MRHLVPRASVVLLVVGLVLAMAPAAAQNKDAAPSLEVLLGRLSRTASLFRDTALEFGCREIISWRGFGRPRKETFEYVFVYDDKEGFKDYRTVPFVGKRSKIPEEVSPGDYGVPRYLRSAYLWIFAFRSSRQGLHHYRMVGEEEVLGVQAVQIAFEPIQPYQKNVNDWFGVAWVDPELGQLLKVVAYEPKEYEKKHDFEAQRAGRMIDRGTAQYETITTLFTEEKNGLRFPGQVVFDSSIYQWQRGRGFGEPSKSTELRVEQRYRNYRFFSVRTADEIRGHILDKGRP